MRNCWEKNLPIPQTDPEVFCLTMKWFINGPCSDHYSIPSFSPSPAAVGTHRRGPEGKQMSLVCPASQAPQAQVWTLSLVFALDLENSAQGDHSAPCWGSARAWHWGTNKHHGVQVLGGPRAASAAILQSWCRSQLLPPKVSIKQQVQ